MGKVESAEILDRYGIVLKERLSQHVLIDEGMLDLLAHQVIPGADVLEIGVGTGNITAVAAEKARRVLGIEIDRRFEPILDELQLEFPNVEIFYRDALSIDFRRLVDPEVNKTEWQVISNLPFHISEPFLKKLADLPVVNTILIVGDSLARAMQIDNPSSGEFTRTSLLAQTFFDVSVLADIGKNMFYPPPRTNASLVVLTPREKLEFQVNPCLATLRRLFLTEHKNPTVEKVIKEARERIREEGKVKSNRLHRREVRQELRQYVHVMNNRGIPDEERPRTKQSRLSIKESGLPERILSTPFSRLDNQDLRMLALSLQERFS